MDELVSFGDSPLVRRTDGVARQVLIDDELIDVTFRYEHAGRRADQSARSEAPYGLAALLMQAEWWRPQAGPPVRVADMTDTHRLHTARFVLNRATAALGMYPEQVKASPLVVSLLAELPRPGEPGWGDLLERTTHWSTCPRNRDLSAPACSADCQPKTEAWNNRPRELVVDYSGDAAGVNGL